MSEATSDLGYLLACGLVTLFFIIVRGRDENN